MDRTARVLDLAGGHCDLRERLEAVPPSARARGLYFRSVAGSVARLGKTAEWRALCEPRDYGVLEYYPTAEYLVCLVAAGAVVRSPEDVHEGMREVCRQHARAYTDSLLGRTILRLLSPDPQTLLRQGLAAQRHTHTHARWSLEFPTRGSARMHMRQEFDFIESSLVGAAEGTFEMIGVPVKVEVELRSRFEGVHHLSW